MRGQRQAARVSRRAVRDDDGGLSSGSDSGSASSSSGGGDGGYGAVASRRAARSAGSSEGAAEEDPSYGEAPRSGGSCGSPQELSLPDIQSCFSLGLREAANRLGVCATTLKRHCRKHGILKWPNRELKKYNRAMAEIQRLHSDSGARLPLPPEIAAAAAAAAAGGRASQGRSQGSGGTQDTDDGAARTKPPRSTASAARRQRPSRRQAKGTPVETPAPASPASVRTHSDRTVGRRQPLTPEISDAPSMHGAANAWTASESGTPSLNAARNGQGMDDQQQLAAAGAQRSVTHEPHLQQWPPPLPPSPSEHAGFNAPGGHLAAGDASLLGLHRHQAAVAMQHYAVAQGHWPGIQLAHETLAQYQQALPQGGLAGGQIAWPADLQLGGMNQGARAPAALESHMQQWQRQPAQEPAFGHHERPRSHPAMQQQPWSLSGATEARQQALLQQPFSLQGLQELQQLAAQQSGWEDQASDQPPPQQAPLPSVGAWTASSTPLLEGHPTGPHCQPLPAPSAQMPGTQVFRPFETAHEGLSIGGSSGPIMPGAMGQLDAWLSRTSAPDEGGGLLPEGRYRQPVGLGGGLPEPAFGFGGQSSHGLRHGTGHNMSKGSMDGLVATFLPHAMPSTDMAPASPSI